MKVSSLNLVLQMMTKVQRCIRRECKEHYSNFLIKPFLHHSQKQNTPNPKHWCNHNNNNINKTQITNKGTHFLSHERQKKHLWSSLTAFSVIAAPSLRQRLQGSIPFVHEWFPRTSCHRFEKPRWRLRPFSRPALPHSQAQSHTRLYSTAPL